MSKINFDFLIRIFVLIIDFKVSSNKKIILNVETFIKGFLYENNELKITIECNKNKEIVNSKNILNKNLCCNLDKCVFIFCCIKNIMSFFRKFINYNANRVVIVKIEQIDNEVYNYVLLSFDEHREKYKKIIVTIVENFKTTTNITISNVLIDNNFYFKSIVVANNNLQNTYRVWIIAHWKVM